MEVRTEAQAERGDPAPMGPRIRAFGLDYLVILAYGVLLVAVGLLLQSVLAPLFSRSAATAEATAFLLVTLPVSLYFALSESGGSQGTWGKRRMGLKVVDARGERIGLMRSLVRSAVKFIPWELAHFVIWRFMLPTSLSTARLNLLLGVVWLGVFLYLFTPFLNKGRRSIYDMVAGTWVVRNTTAD